VSDGRSAAMPAPDVVDLLVRQHREIRELFVEVLRASEERRGEYFSRLVHLLAIHETAEEEVVHPLARARIPEGDAVIDDRLAEEHDAKELLARMDGMDASDPKFLLLLDDLRDAVLVHAQREERYEFNWLRQRIPESQLRAAAKVVRAAEATAPTHPHPGIESAKANLIAGPPLAFVDRVRDAIRKARD
jgi:hemerythrin superfamily protein